ncbi:MAG: hypothetical protein J5608_02595 [Alphaproteobacteria bacterium]|nr:hypothetical protein [Alphaproteobacteria bacterium]
MRRLGIILVFCAFWATDGIAASRVSGASNQKTTVSTTRAGANTQQVRTKTVTSRQSVRVTKPKQKTVNRTATTPKATAVVNAARALTNRSETKKSRATTTNIVARAATTETRTGAEYEQCKNAYFECMDQFCQLKSDEYRRCSCSDRITSLQTARDKLTQAGEQLAAFNENLDIVGKTAAQATAMNTASDGELALTKDKSASKALLTAIMNTIRGDDAKVENSQLSDLNSIDLSFDSTNSFGMEDVGQAVASYNGTALYSAVYPQCRNAVKSNCNDASLQRAVNAYLMAIEQDCNTVQTAINKKQKETHAAIRESSSMLDMARAENHKNHNSDDIATCLTNVETAVLSEEVCGTNYHKCLDNGEYIDVTTGAPIAGVVDFYKLGQMLTFATGRNNADQKLAQNINNQIFVSNFEKRVKQFAEPALDKCRDDADTVWQEYLNKALLDIYYAQQSKVNEIQQGCFDFVSACYMNGSDAMTSAMKELLAAQTTILKPNTTKLNKSLCDDYIKSCNNMFDGDIVAAYIDKRHDTDSLSSCRAVVQQCFDNYGGQNYENFYNPSSGLFSAGEAPQWFSLYEIKNNKYRCNNSTAVADTPEGCAGSGGVYYVSECAKQIAAIDACKDKVEEAFGGLDYHPVSISPVYTTYNKYRYGTQSRNLRSAGIATEVYNQIIDLLQTQCTNLDGSFMNVQNLELYSYNYKSTNFCEATFKQNNSRYRNFVSIYGILSADITSNGGYSLVCDAPPQGPSGNDSQVDLDRDNQGHSALNPSKISKKIRTKHSARFSPISRANCHLEPRTNNISVTENMCPRNYGISVDVQSWGACLCWENGGRRSNNGTSTRCVASFPVNPLVTYEHDGTTTQQTTVRGKDNPCVMSQYYCLSSTASSSASCTSTTNMFDLWTDNAIPTEQDWCTGTVNSQNQVCPFGVVLQQNNKECKQCPEGWAQSGNLCCPSGYTLQQNFCCPTNYTINTSDTPAQCIGTNDATTDAIKALPTSSVLMTADPTQGIGFPEGN